MLFLALTLGVIAAYFAVKADRGGYNKFDYYRWTE